MSSTFNVTDLCPCFADEPVLRLKPFEERGNDEDIQPELEPYLTEPDIQDMISKITKPETIQEVSVPTVFKGAITRQRPKILQHKFNESMILASDLGHVKLTEGAAEDNIKKGALKIEESSLKKDGPAEKTRASSEDLWPFIPDQAHKNLMVITDITQITIRSELLSQIGGSDVVLGDRIHKKLGNLINLIRFVKLVCLMFLM